MNAEFDENLAACEALREPIKEAVDLLMDFARIVDEQGVTIQELTDGLQLAVGAGWDTMEICLAMGSIAVRRAGPNSRYQ